MKKALSLILTMAMLIGVFASVAIVNTSAIEEGEAPTATPVAVSTAAEFAAMSQTGVYYLAGDITLESTYAGTFEGTLDGKSHTLTIAAPIFNEINGTVKDLKIDGAVTGDTAGNFGALACKATGGKYENITNNASVKVSTESGFYAGGLFGIIEQKEVTITGCENKGEIQGYVSGGLVGENKSVLTASNVKNSAVVYGYNFAGGMLGHALANGSFNNAENSGKIDTNADSVGGIIGLIAGKLTFSFENCQNSGAISTVKDTAGGIVGYSQGESRLSFENCKNSAAITSGTSAYNAGGILGHISGFVTLKYCTNTGNIVGTAAHAGGILGVSTAETTIEHCYNSGTVTAKKQGGGIAGRVTIDQDNAVFKYCGNEGNVTTDTDTCGGITAYARGSATTHPEFYYCYNTGNLSSGCESGSMIGYFNGTTAAKFIACYNTGVITGTDANYTPCALYWSKNSAAVLAENISGFYYTPDCAQAELHYGSTYAPFNSNITAAEVASGKLCYLLNQAAGSDVYFQTIGTDTHPVLDSTHKSVMLVNDEYINGIILEKADGTKANMDNLVAAVEAATEGSTIHVYEETTISADVTLAKAGVNFTIDFHNYKVNSSKLITLNISAATLTIKNFEFVASAACLKAAAQASDAAKGKYVFNNGSITTTSGAALQVSTYNDLTVDGVTINAAGNCIQTVNDGHNALVINNLTATSQTGYGIYLRKYSTLETNNVNITVNGTSSGIQIITATGFADATGDGSVAVLNNTNVTSTNERYALTTNPYNKVTINGGSYTAPYTGATINCGNKYGYVRINSGTFTGEGYAAVRCYGEGSVVDIYDGTFITNGGNEVIKAGTKEADGGTFNIYGGTFIKNGGDPLFPVMNKAANNAVIEITGSNTVVKKDEAAGASKVLDTILKAESPSAADAISFAEGKLEYKFNVYTVTWEIEGVKTTEEYNKDAIPSYKGEAPTKAADAENTYTFSGWDKELAAVTADITFVANFTATPIASTTTDDNPTNTTDPTVTTDPDVSNDPSDTTEPDASQLPQEGCEGCGGFSIFAIVALIVCGLFGTALIKKF